MHCAYVKYENLSSQRVTGLRDEVCLFLVLSYLLIPHSGKLQASSSLLILEMLWNNLRLVICVLSY